MIVPEIHYAKNGEVHIAYCIVGEGPVDIIYVAPYISNIELMWERPAIARFLARLAGIGRLICVDKRGMGLSDRLENEVPDLETRMDDIRVVMDAAGCERAFLYCLSESGYLGIAFAATHPGRTVGLILQGAYPRGSQALDYPFGRTATELAEVETRIEQGWGDDSFAAWFAAGVYDTDVHGLARQLRSGASPGAALALERWDYATDVRDVLPAIRVPTLVLYRTAEGHSDEARYLAEHISGARHIEHPGHDHVPWHGDTDAVVREVARFVRDVRDEEAMLDRALLTILFTDIVDSTARAAALGDRRWADVLRAHHQRVRGSLARFRGREVDTAGDGFFAVFDGPARAVRCARAIADGVADLGIEIRAGLHTGECEIVGEMVGGLAVHIGARISALAGPSEILASSTVKDLTAGSGLDFEDAGEHELKGVPERWRLYRVAT